MEVRHTYRIKHKGVEGTPYTISDLRQMWKAGQIDASTEFKRGDSEVWLEANDLLPELEFRGHESGKITETPDPAILHGLEFSRLTPIAPQSVRLTSVRLPFREVFVLVFKFYLAVLLIAALATVTWVLVARYLR